MGVGRVIGAVIGGTNGLRLRCVLLVAVIATLLAAPVAAAREDYIRVELSFGPGCEGRGYVGFTGESSDPRQGAAERPVLWTPGGTVIVEHYSPSPGEDVTVFLYDEALAATLFSALTRRVPGSTTDFVLSGMLDCSSVPYRLAAPDTGTVPASLPARGHDQWVLVATIFAAFSFAATLRRRYEPR